MSQFLRAGFVGSALLSSCLITCWSCSSFELPTPPALAGLNDRYENPTAQIDRSTVAPLIDRFFERRDQLETTNRFEVVRDMVTDFEGSVTVSDDPDDPSIEISGIPIDADAVVTVTSTCSTDAAESAPPGILARAVIERSRLNPTIWGSLEGCQIELPDGRTPSSARVSGEIDVYAPTLLRDVAPVYLIRYDLSKLVLAGRQQPPFDGHLRFVDDTLEFLLTDEEATAVLFGTPDPNVVGIRGANGTWQCTPEERTCESRTSSESFSY